MNATPASRHRPVAGIVLAAGGATRFGAAKQLLPWENATLVGHAARTALDAGLDPVVVVTGFEAEKVSAAVAHLPVQAVFNSEWTSGQSSSLGRGIAALPSHIAAAVFLLADQPGVTPEVLLALVRTYCEKPGPIVLPTYEGRRGNPVLFDKALFGELRALKGDIGGRALITRYEAAIIRVPVNDPAILQDIDTPADYRRS